MYCFMLLCLCITSICVSSMKHVLCFSNLVWGVHIPHNSCVPASVLDAKISIFKYACNDKVCVCVCLQEEFCYPVECLSLTIEEAMHIRQVLVKAELEKFQQYKDVYNALKKGKVIAAVFLRLGFKARSLALHSYT